MRVLPSFTRIVLFSLFIISHNTQENIAKKLTVEGMMKEAPIIQVKGLTKRFPGVVALDKVDLNIQAGEIHILVGENGAGKSTLVKILCGIYQADAGELYFEGRPYQPHSTLDSISAGIRVIHQEMSLLSYLSVAENIFLESLPQRFGMVDRKKLYNETKTLLNSVGLKVSPNTTVERLGIAQMQLVEIAKALSDESKVLIMDEPTATLSPRETESLFRIIKSLKSKGVTVIYISHRLQEIYEIGNRVTVLRNGQKVETCPLSEVGITQIVKMMVGRELSDEFPFRDSVVPSNEILRVENLMVKGSRDPINFSLKRGEILGIAGLVGSGRTEMARALFGADGRVHGNITIDGKAVDIHTPRQAIEQGLCLLTEDRKEEGLILEMSCSANITLTHLSRVSRIGMLKRDVETKVSKKLIEDLSVKTPSPHQIIKNLSGGNQQKVVLAKWLFKNPKVFIFDEPTRGIDVGAKFEIYNLIWDLAEEGKGIIIISSELPELIGVCHRLLVMSKRVMTGEVKRDDFDAERILSLAYKEYLTIGSKNGTEKSTNVYH